MNRSVFARLKRKNIFKNTSTENHLPKNHSGTSRKKMFPSTERKSITAVSSVRNAVTLLETVLTSLPKLFSYNIFNILPSYMRTKMLTQTFLNNQNKMTKLLSLSQNLQILRIFQSSLQFKMLTMFPPFPDLHSKCQSFLLSFINVFLSLGLLTLVQIPI